MAGDAFETNDPAAKGAEQLVKAGSTSFADSSEQRLAAADVSPEKADSFGIKGDTADSIESMPRTRDSGMSAKEEGFRNTVERSKGTEEYNRIAASGLQDADNSGRYSRAEVAAEMRDGRNGKTTEEMAAYYQNLADSGTKFNTQAQDYLKKHGVTFGGGSSKGKAGSDNGGSEGGGGGGAGGNNEGGVDDTEGKNAQEFADRYKYKVNEFTHKPRDYDQISTAIANRALERADQRDLPELIALQKSVDRNPIYWKSRSDVQTGDYLGDIWNFKTPDFKMPKPLDAVEAPDISGIADDYMDRIDSIKPEL